MRRAASWLALLLPFVGGCCSENASETTHKGPPDGDPIATLRLAKIGVTFEACEHHLLGNKANPVAYQWVWGQRIFELKHGDLVMLSGDYTAPEDFLELAFAASNLHGDEAATQDELACAKQIALAACPEREPRPFSAEVRRNVLARYLRQSAANDLHFSEPDLSDATKGALSEYRRLHEDALWEAYSRAATGAPDAEAQGMLREGLAEHFLTDAFAAGHVRTPITSIRRYWRWRYPHFIAGFKKKLAKDVAAHMKDHALGYLTVLPITAFVEGSVRDSLEQQAAGLESVGLGDLVASTLHDLDNRDGLMLTSAKHPAPWLGYGDAFLEEKSTTFDEAVKAIKAGLADVTTALALGKSTRGLRREKVLERIRAGGDYAALAFVPRPAPGVPAQVWLARDVNELWLTVVRPDHSDMTFGMEVERLLRTYDSPIRILLREIAERFPERQSCGGTTFYPREAFELGFVQNLIEHPKGVLDEILALGEE